MEVRKQGLDHALELDDRFAPGTLNSIRVRPYLLSESNDLLEHGRVDGRNIRLWVSPVTVVLLL
jgi:hypothetical protein